MEIELFEKPAIDLSTRPFIDGSKLSTINNIYNRYVELKHMTQQRTIASCGVYLIIGQDDDFADAEYFGLNSTRVFDFLVKELESLKNELTSWGIKV
jgi:hypothetical protein